MTPLRKTCLLRHPEHGFTLIEVMVGMIIGMIGMIVMMQVFLNSDASKRSTSGGGDAQTNGTGALHALERDMRQGGFGIATPELYGCSLVLRSGVTLAMLAPLQINATQIPAGDPNTDTLLIMYANSAGSPEGDTIISKPNTNTYAVTAPIMFAVGDWIVAQFATQPTPCALTLEQVQASTSIPPNVTVPDGVAAITSGILYNFGPSPRFLAYAVRSGKLTVCDFMAADCSNASLKANPSIWSPVAGNIVSMRAQYGRDTNLISMDAIVDGFDQVTPGSPADTSGLALNCSVARVLAARLVLVARSSSFEKTMVTSGAPQWLGSSATTAAAPWPGAAAVAIDLSLLADGTDNLAWQNYRYKAFQTIVPLRNLLQIGVPSKC
jgi:type IV pilus assembly protein PilW